LVSKLSLTLAGILAVLLVALAGSYLTPPGREVATKTTTQEGAVDTRTVTELKESTMTEVTTETATPLPLRRMSVEVAFPNLSFNRMVHLTHAGDGTNRLFLTLQSGQILVFPNVEGVRTTQVFLDISDRVDSSGTEEGLLSLAFDPDYKENGYFYVYYTASQPERSVLSRFSVSRSDPNRADPQSELVLLEVAQPAPNHNGGALTFGPDGYLYLGLGDGGGAGDPFGNGQNRSTLLGSILRLDVSASSPQERYRIPSDNPYLGQGKYKEEIWAYGLRNPWRMAFDKVTGLLWVADVGQNLYEEVDIVMRGRNYGWNIMEGFHCFPPSITSCEQGGLELPLIEYTHSEGCSITGGYVYRGRRLGPLYGAYVYGDFCSGKIWALRFDGVRVIEHMEIADTSLEISSFGEDEQGELYILSHFGKIYRFKSN